MARTANVFARVEPEVKEQAEQVLDRLGIPMSNAVGMFLRQIVLQRGIPLWSTICLRNIPTALDIGMPSRSSTCSACSFTSGSTRANTFAVLAIDIASSFFFIIFRLIANCKQFALFFNIVFHPNSMYLGRQVIYKTLYFCKKYNDA